MKLEEYLRKVRRNNALSRMEIDLFGFTDMSKGWTKRYADFDIPEDVLEFLITNRPVAGTRKRSASRKIHREATRIKNYHITSDKKLYVMKNIHGDLKIGISVDPVKRARNLTTASGSVVTLLSAWELEKNSRIVESDLHKEYKAYRKEGEWFSPKSFTIEEIERKIPCAFVRVFTGETDPYVPENRTEEYEFNKIVHETEKAVLFLVEGESVWVAKTMIISICSENKLIKVPAGIISGKIGDNAC